MFIFYNDINSFHYKEYMSILVFIIISLSIIVIVSLLTYKTSVYNPDSEKLSTYECGFEPYENSKDVFNIKFYLIAILFLIFDVETSFILPWSVSISKINIASYWTMIEFIIELSVGYVYIWFIGAINWD